MRSFYTMPDCRDVYSDIFFFINARLVFFVWFFLQRKQEKCSNQSLRKRKENQKISLVSLNSLKCRKWCAIGELSLTQLYSLRMYIIVHMKIYSSMRVTLLDAREHADLYIYICIYICSLKESKISVWL